jgi:hypothetical protein
VQVVVDLSSGSVSLSEPDDTDRFSLLVLPASPQDPGDTSALGAVAAALSVHDAGIVDPEGNAFIPTEVVRRLAEEGAAAGGGLLGSDWEPRFTAMVEQATSRGWVTDEGSIQAHIEWERP